MQEREKGGGAMRESNDYTEDLDDLIFDEDDGHPSERWQHRAEMPGIFVFFGFFSFPTLQNVSFRL